MTEAAAPYPLIFDHDGGVDDFITLVILATAQAAPDRCYGRGLPAGAVVPPYRLIGVTVVEADCFAEPCADVCRRVLALYAPVCPALLQVPVAHSPLRGTAAPFPDDWRKDSYCLADSPVLHSPAVCEALKRRCVDPDDGKAAHRLMASLVVDSPVPVTIVVTGPLTNVAYGLAEHGAAFATKIERVVVMGGAARVQGNVFGKNIPSGAPSVDSSQEWNIYWDAPAAKAVFEHPLLAGKIVLFTLDATNQVPVTSQLCRRFGSETALPAAPSQPSSLGLFVGGAWSLCTWIPKWAGQSYFAWDSLTAAFLVDPSIVTRSALQAVTVEAQPGHPSEGRTIVHDAEGGDDAGRVPNVHVIYDVDAERFYQLAVDAAKAI